MQTVVFAVLGLVSMVVGLLMTLILPQTGILAWGLIALGIILEIVAFLLGFRRVKGAVTSRRGKYGTSTSLMVIFFAGIIIFVNSISIGVNHQFDFTALSTFTLTAQTKDVLAKIDTNINVLCFFTPTDDTSHTEAYALNMIAQYQDYTKYLTLIIWDPDQHPEVARKYGITNSSSYRSVVFECPKTASTVTVSPTQIIDTTYNTFYAENSFTNAILEVTGIKEKLIYFVTGDGEASPYDTLSTLGDALQTNLLQVKTIDLQMETSIPDDCAVLVVAGPIKPMTDDERQIIANYLANNKCAILMTNPSAPDDISKLLAPYGASAPGGTIIDPSSYLTPERDTPTVPKARDALGLSSVYFPGATAIVMGNTSTQMGVTPLVWTSGDSWVDKNYNPSVAPVFDSTTEVKNLYDIGVLIAPNEVTDSSGNATGKTYAGPYIVALGDSDFITNSHFNNGDNGELFLSLVKWLGAGSDIVTIENRGLTSRRLILSPEQASFLNISSIALLPAIVLLVGVLMWWRRR
jgi:hypothetical protein